MELDNENSKYYSTYFRVINPSLSRWNSLDPIINAKQSPFSSLDNNPIYYIDKTGAESQSTHIDKNGKVIAVYIDGDKGIYQHSVNADGKNPTKYQLDKRHEKWGKSARGKKIGETEYEDEFLVPKIDNSKPTEILKNTTVLIGTSWSPLVDWGNNKANRYDLSITQKKSRSGEELDIKTNKEWAPNYTGGVMTGRLLNGKYVSARSAGNYLAGLNGATGTFQGSYISKVTYMKLAGLYQQGALGFWSAADVVLNNGKVGELFGKYKLKPPYYGEMDYSGRMISKGFDAGLAKRK
jgi:RHS repeat-associated protein